MRTEQLSRKDKEQEEGRGFTRHLELSQSDDMRPVLECLDEEWVGDTQNHVRPEEEQV